jgi:hypothetical protein
MSPASPTTSSFTVFSIPIGRKASFSDVSQDVNTTETQANEVDLTEEGGASSQQAAEVEDGEIEDLENVVHPLYDECCSAAHR